MAICKYQMPNVGVYIEMMKSPNIILRAKSPLDQVTIVITLVKTLLKI